MYYAEHRPNNDYVCSFGVNRAPSLFQFETKHERDEWVKKGNYTLIKDEWFPISSKDAAARYDLANFDDLDCSVEFGAGFWRTCAGKIVRYIEPRG